MEVRAPLIATARKIPGSHCVVLDLPNVTKVAESIITNESEDAQKRLSTLSLSATAPDEWKGVVEDESMLRCFDELRQRTCTIVTHLHYRNSVARNSNNLRQDTLNLSI